MDKIVDYIIKLSPVLIAAWALYLSFNNRRSKLREVLYEKQYELLLELNQKIIDIETEIQILRQRIEKRDELEIQDSKTKYVDNLKNIVSLVELKGSLILPKNIIKSTLDIVTLYTDILPEILDSTKNLHSNDLFVNRIKELYSWQNIIREHIGIEKLSHENKKIIG
jgi:hypothetical protein